MLKALQRVCRDWHKPQNARYLKLQIEILDFIRFSIRSKEGLSSSEFKFFRERILNAREYHAIGFLPLKLWLASLIFDGDSLTSRAELARRVRIRLQAKTFILKAKLFV